MYPLFAAMQRYGLTTLLVTLLAGFLSACGSDTTFTAIEDIKITLTTNPKPLTTGDGELFIYLTRSNWDPIDDVQVTVSATASGMKTGVQEGIAVRRGNGVYVY